MLGGAVARWPEAVPAQVLRTRLAAYAALYTDADFEQGVCAVCARWKRRTKLQPATFPARGAAAAPAWRSFSFAEWQKQGDAWWAAVDNILDVEQYLQRHFHADDRLRDAQAGGGLRRGGCDGDIRRPSTADKGGAGSALA